MKGILIMDIPHSCFDCPLYESCNYAGAYEIGHKQTRSEGCPIKPLEEFELVRDELKKRMEHPERYAQR